MNKNTVNNNGVEVLGGEKEMKKEVRYTGKYSANSEEATKEMIELLKAIEFNGGNKFAGFKFTKKGIKKFRNKFTGSDTKNIMTQTIEVKEKDGVKTYKIDKRQITALKDSNFRQFINDFKTTTLDLNGEKTKVKDFSSKFLMLQLDIDIVNTILDTKAWPLYNVKTGDLLLKTAEGYKSLFTKKVYKVVPKSYKEYFLGIYTASSIKESKALFVRKDSEGESWITLCEDVMPGFHSKVMAGKAVSYEEVDRKNVAMVPGKRASVEETIVTKRMMTREDIVKLAGRPGLFYTGGNILLSDVGCIAIYDGSFDAVTNMADGAGWIITDVIMAMFNLESEKDAYGIQLQPRTNGGADKAMVFAKDRASAEEWVENRKDKIRYVGDKTKPIALILDANCNKIAIDAINGKVDFKVLAIGKMSEGKVSKQALQKVFFEAALQGRFDEVYNYIIEQGGREIKETIESIFASSAKKAKLGSTYVLDSLRQLDPHNVALYNSTKRDAYNTILKMINKLGLHLNFEDGTPSIYNQVVTPDIIAMSTDGVQQLLKVNEKDGTFEVYSAKISQEMGYYARKIEKLTEKDAEAHAEEIAEAQAELDRLKERFEQAIIIKYPTIYLREYGVAKVVDSWTLEKRIREMELSKAERNNAIKSLWNLSESVLMFPASPAIYKLLAGMDNDFDKAIIIFNKMINSILTSNHARINLSTTKAIVDKAAAGEMFDIDDEFTMLKVVKGQLSQSANIGVITNWHEKLAMIGIDLLSEDKAIRDCAVNAMKQILRECGITTKGEKRLYAAKLSTYFNEDGSIKNADVVDEAFSYAMREEISQVEWTVENLVLFVDDASKIFRLYQEGAIDAAKTGEFIEQLFTVKTIVLMSQIECLIENDEEGNMKFVRGKYFRKEGDIVKIFDENGNVVDEIPAIEYYDAFAAIQDELMAYMNEEIKGYIDSKEGIFSYTEDQIADFRAVFDFYNQGAVYTSKAKNELALIRARNTQQILNLRNVYFGMVGDKLKELADISKQYKADDKAAERFQKEINEKFNRTLDAMATTIAELLDEMKIPADHKGALMLAIGCHKKDKQNRTYFFDANSGSRFAYLVASRFVYEYLIGSSTMVTFEEAYGAELEDGTVVSLEGGLDRKNGVLVESNYTGKAVYHTGEDYNYVQVDVDLAEVELSKEKLVVIKGSEEFLKDKYDMIQLSEDNQFIIAGNNVYYSKDENDGMHQVNPSDKAAYVNSCKADACYEVTAIKKVYNRQESKVEKLNYIVLTVRELELA